VGDVCAQVRGTKSEREGRKIGQRSGRDKELDGVRKRIGGLGRRSKNRDEKVSDVGAKLS